MATTSKQRLALAICDFLSSSVADGSVPADDRDSIDVAVNCIAESFRVDPSDRAAVSEAVGDQDLLKIYAVYEKLKGATRTGAGGAADAAKPAAGAGSGAAAPPAAPPSRPGPVSDDDAKQADALKSKGNAAMARKEYARAVDLYTEALRLNPGNPVYLSNRAAAHGAQDDYESARADAEAAVAIQPEYTKAWGRLGFARFALGDAKGSMEAYQKGIEHEGNGGSDAMKKGFEAAKKRVEEMDSADAGVASRGAAGPAAGGPSLSSLAGLFGAGGSGGGGGGGMPDLGSIMNNPMFASMAQNLMSNPELMQNIMSNPRLREMASSFGGGGGGGGGGGMPDMAALMSDPTIASMARNLMGGSGGAPGGAPEAGPGSGRGSGSGAP